MSMKTQMELTFDRACSVRLQARRQRRLPRAQWWFAQMRQAVDRTWDRHLAGPARPEQIYLPVSRRPMVD